VNLRRRPRAVSEVNTHSLNDIMFFLLLFFLITSTLVNPNIIKLTLPKSGKEVKDSPKNVTISLAADRKIFLNKNAVNMQDLEAQLRILVGETKEPIILLAADKDVDWGTVVEVMNIGRKLHAKVLAATEQEGK